jgi:hypothetical protein
MKQLGHDVYYMIQDAGPTTTLARQERLDRLEPPTVEHLNKVMSAFGWIINGLISFRPV